MTFLDYSKSLEKIITLADSKMTGPPKELAKQLGVSERTVKRKIKVLQEKGISIRYCRYENSYIIQ